MRRGCLYGLFFLSGVSALAYELTWQRLLHLLFGVSTPAVSAVLAAYMAGLALGGVLFGRLADRARQPLRLYACLEGAIAVAALLVPAAFALLTEGYTALHARLQPGPWLATLLRFGLSFLLLLLPASLLGGTLPFMGRLAVRPARGRPAAFSLLYGVNTLGAVVGAALTGLLLIRWLGTHATITLAAGLNGLAALGAVGLSLWPLPEWHEASAEEPTAAPPAASRWPLFAAALTGAVTTGLEVAWTRVLGIFTSNSAYAFAVVLTVVLLGLGLGGLLQAAWSRRPGDNRLRLTVCQAALALLTLVSLPYFHTPPAWLTDLYGTAPPGRIFLAELALTAAALLGPSVLMGLSFPLLAEETTATTRRLSHRLGGLYAVNTLGCVAGAVLAGFVLIPGLGIQNTFGVLTAGSVAAGLIALAAARWPSVAWRATTAGTVSLAALAAWHQLPSGGFLKAPVEEPRRLVYYQEGDNGTVSVVEESTGDRHLLVDGQPVAGTSPTSVVDQKMLAHLPLLLHPAPQRALTVGFGSGGTSHSMRLHGVAVDCVEIEPAVPAAADHFHSENYGVRGDSAFHLVLDDARSWLRVAPTAYDAIVTDCTNLQYKSNGDLYTVEYFDLMRRRLTPTGIAAAWVPANGIADADLRTLLRSFRHVFPHTSVWHMNCLPTDFLIVVGTPGPLAIDLEELGRRMAVPAVRQDLEQVGLTDSCALLCTCLVADADLDGYLGDGPLNTDDRPVLSYSTYGASYRSTIAGNLVGLLACRGDMGQHVRHGPDAATQLRHQVASNEAFLGHLALWNGDPQGALGHYAAGARVLPDDPALKRLVVSVYLQVRNPSR
jgi:spermidine synthase